MANDPEEEGVDRGRRHFWRDLLKHALVAHEEAKGIQHLSLDNLAKLPDAVMAEMVPVWREGRGVELRGDGLYGPRDRRTGAAGEDEAPGGQSAESVRLYPCSPREHIVLDQFGCGRNLQAIAAHLAEQSGLDASAAFQATRSLFVRLAQRGLCHPAAAHSRE